MATRAERSLRLTSFALAVPQSGVMNPETAQLVGAGIGVGGALLGALGGYFAGRAQAKGTVDGVQLQLSGQRADSLWQIRREAYVALAQQLDAARISLGELSTLLSLDAPSQDALAAAGVDSLEEARHRLFQTNKNCWSCEFAFRLSVSASEALAASVVRHALTSAVDAADAWCLSRLAGSSNQDELREEFLDLYADFKGEHNAFVLNAQQRLREGLLEGPFS